MSEREIDRKRFLRGKKYQKFRQNVRVLELKAAFYSIGRERKRGVNEQLIRRMQKTYKKTRNQVRGK